MKHYTVKETPTFEAVCWDGDFDGKAFSQLQQMFGEDRVICLENPLSLGKESKDTLAIFIMGSWCIVPVGAYVTEHTLFEYKDFNKLYVLHHDDEE